MSLEDAKEYTRWVGRGVFFAILIFMALQFMPIGRDDTDPEWPKRSGLRPLIDAATGCEYLSTPSGGLTPRLDGTGRHKGCRT